MYGIKPYHADEEKSAEGEGEEDIEASIEAELNSLKEKKKTAPHDRTFTSMNTGIECVFFLKTKPPVDPAALVRRMCLDARDGVEGVTRCRYVNRLVPVVDVERATEGGMEKLGRGVLGAEFVVKGGGGEGGECYGEF